MKKWFILISLLLCVALLAACNTPPSGGNQGNGGSENGGSGNGGSGNGGSVSNPNGEKIKGYLATLLSDFRVDPFSYLPDSMVPGANAVNGASLNLNYANAVNVSSIPTDGFGEQWNMIVENIVESQRFFKALSIVDGLTTTSVAIFNNYLDNNPADTASHSFKNGIYTVSIVYEDGILDYVIDYEQGGLHPQIALSLDIESGEKTVRVQLTDANALRYVVSEDSYEFAIRYAGVRRAYFSLARTEEGTVGHIYEYLTVASVEFCSAADFYITDDSVTAVGNKASGLTGFTGYICELYDAESGKMLGYEVKESLLSLTYNTLWFDLSSFNGFSSIRYRAEDKANSVDAAFFVNGSSNEWEAKKVGVLNPSRRFDIEFRDRFFYVYNAAEDSYEKVCVSVPMLFVQEEYYGSLASDISSTNGITVSSRVDSSDLAILKSEYATKVDVFITNKENVTVDAILGFIGTKETFE